MFKPTLEALEDRFMPAIALAATAVQTGQSAQQVLVTGHVADTAGPANLCQVVLSGHGITITTQPDTNGDFSYTQDFSWLTGYSVVATNPQNDQSNTVNLTIPNNVPTISGFTVVSNGNGNWTFSGAVTDEYAPGMIVTISWNGGSFWTTVGANNGFSVTRQVGNITGLTVSADVTDWWGAHGTNSTAYYLAQGPGGGGSEG